MANSATVKLGVEGAGAFKKELASVTQQGKTLAAEMKATASAFVDEADAEKKNQAVKEKLSQQMDVQQKRIDLLKKAVQDYTTAEGESGNNTLKYREQLAKAESAMSDMQRQAKSLEGGIDDVGDELSDSGDKALTFGDALKANVIGDAIVKGVEALATAIGNVAGKMKDAIVDSAAFADNILTMSTNTGISTETLQEFQYMAELTDTSVDTITGSMKKLTSKMDDVRNGNKTTAEAFNKLGVSVTNEDGTLRDNYDVFMDIIDALGQIENDTERDAVSMDIFGKSAQDLNSLIAQGSEGIAEYAKEAHDMGYVLDDETLSSLGAVDDAIQRSKTLMESVQNQIGVGLAPVIGDLAEKLQEIVGNIDFEAIGQKISDFITFVIDNGSTIISTLTGIGTAIGTFLVAEKVIAMVTAFKKFTEGTTLLKAAQAALNSTMLANPFVLIASLIAGLVAAFITAYKTNDEFKERVDEAWATLKENVGAAIQAVIDFFVNLWTNIKQKMSDIKTAIEDGVKTAIDWVKGKASDFKAKGIELITNLKDGIKEKVEDVKAAAGEIIDAVKDTITGWFTDAWNWGADLIENFKQGIRDAFPGLTNLIDQVRGQSSVDEITGGSSTTNNSTVNITVNGGSDAQSTAREVSRVMQYQVAGINSMYGVG